jgi:putative peptidoglycan lipid II flippase
VCYRAEQVSLAHVLRLRTTRWRPLMPVLTNAALVGALMSAAKLAAAVKVVVTARFFGTSDDLDAFLTAFTVCTIVSEIVGTSFTTALIPALVRTRESLGDRMTNHFVSYSLTVSVAATMAVCLALGLSRNILLPIFGSSFSPAKLQTTAALFVALLFWLPLNAASSAWRAVLNAHSRFALPAAALLITPLLTLAFLYAGAARWGVWVLCVGTLVGVALESAVLAAGVKSLGYSITPAWRLPLRKIAAQFPEWSFLSVQYVPLVAVAAITYSSALVDQAFVGALGSGTVSALAYGTKLVAVLIVVAAAGVGTAVLPEFARLAAARNWPWLRHVTLAYAGAACALMIPVTALLVWFSEPIVRLFFQGGAFDAETTKLVARVQQFALLETPVGILIALGSRMATAVSASSLLAKAGAAALAANTLGDWVLSRKFGVSGIALASPISQLIGLIVLVAMLHHREPRLFAGREGD